MAAAHAEAEAATTDLHAALAAETRRANEAARALQEAEQRHAADRQLLVEQSAAAMAEALADFQLAQEEDALELERATNNANNSMEEAQAMARAVAEEADAEVEAIKAETARTIAAERAASLAARAEAALLRKKLALVHLHEERSLAPMAGP